MNLKSKKARVPIAAVAATGLALGIVGVLATTSSGAASLTLLPSTTSATISNLDRTGATTATQAAAATAYALKFGGLAAGGTDDLKASVTGTTGGVVEVTQAASNGAPDDGVAPVPVNVAGGSSATVGTGASGGDYYYLGSETPGTYQLRFYVDVNTNNSYDPNVDTGAELFTLVVKDVRATTSENTDDLTIGLTAPSRIDKGEVILGKATADELTKADARGLQVGTQFGQLGFAVSQVLTIGTTGAGAAYGPFATTWVNGSTYEVTSSARTSAGTATTTATFGTLTKAVGTEVVDNTVTTVANMNTDTDNVAYPTTYAIGALPGTTGTHGDAAVRVGTSDVVYKVKATTTGGVAVSGAKVFFRILPQAGGSPAIVAADFTTSAGTPDAQGDVGVNTAADGTAMITVTNTKSAAGGTYSVQARSNGNLASTIHAYYATPAVATVTSGGDTTALVGGKVTLTGKVVDQWKKPIAPVGVTAALTYTNNGPAVTPTGGNYAISSDGSFSVEVAETSTSNTTTSTDSYVWTVSGISSTSASVEWARSVTPASVTPVSIDTIGTGGGANSPFPLETTERVTIADSTSLHSNTFVATVKDGDGIALKFADVTLSGTDGVKFLDAQGNAQSTWTGKANSSGQIGVEVVFTKSGEATITTVSGGISAATKVTVQDPVEAWKVGIFDTQGDPGENVTLTGTVADVWGNPVPNASNIVTLSIPDSEFGTITTGTTYSTNSFGKFNAIFTSGSQDSGIITTRVEIASGPPNRAPASLATLGGLAASDSTDRAEGKITVKVSNVTLSVEPSRISAGPVDFSGTATPGSTIDLYAKRTGTSDEYRVVKTVEVDSQGQFGGSINVVRSNTFFAQMGTVRSDQMTTTVFSKVTFTARSLGGGRVELRADGNPNQATKMSFYTVGAGGKLSKIETVQTNGKGFGSTVWETDAGEKTVRAYYVATGTRTGFAQAQVVVP